MKATQSAFSEAILLLCGLSHMLLYVFLAPPWQHYDEPTHFEYAMLIRELGHIPELQEDLWWVRREIAQSMLQEGFFGHPQTNLPEPDLDDADLSIGFNERTHPPLYYLLVAGITDLADTAPLRTQLYLARLFSATLGVLLLYSSVYLLRDVSPDSGLRAGVLAILVLHPGLADTMSSVNNDTLANLVAVWLLIAAIRSLRQPGYRWIVIGLFLGLLAWHVKRTLVGYTIILPFAWLLARPGLLRRWLLVGVGVLIALIIGLHTHVRWELSAWHSIVPQPPAGAEPSRVWQRDSAPYAGQAVFRLERPPNGPGPMLEQEIYPLLRNNVKGQIVTLAGWMRADRDALLAFTPAIQVDQAIVQDSVYVGTQWRYVVTATWIPTDTAYLAVRLGGPLSPGVVYYDSLSLIVGSTPGDAYLPDGMFDQPLLDAGTPRNLLRNASAELLIPVLPSRVTQLGGRHLSANNAQQMLETIFNRPWIARVYPQQIMGLFQGFWGVFGWGEISVAPGWFTSLGLIVISSLFGNLRYIWHVGESRGPGVLIAKPIWWLCCVAVCAGWGMALLRVHLQPIPGAFIWSFGRYTFIAIVPSAILFTVGVATCLPAPLRQQGMRGVLVFLFLFAVLTLATTLIPYWFTFSAH